jgi:hypothetical protein
MYKRPEIRASLEVILSVFTVTILVFAAIRPTLTNIVSLQKKIEDQEVVNKKADNKIAQLLSAQTQLNTFRSSLRLFDEAVPDDFSYIDGAKRLEYVARKNNLEVETVTFPGYTIFGGGKVVGDWFAKIIKPNANILSAQLSFNVVGKPQDVISFLKEIENMDRLVSLNSVSLTKQVGVSRAEDSLKATGQMTFYFYTQQQ